MKTLSTRSLVRALNIPPRVDFGAWTADRVTAPSGVSTLLMAASEKQQEQGHPWPSGTSTDEDFSVLVLASDLGIDARSFLQSNSSSSLQPPPPASPADGEIWHDCPSSLPASYLPLIDEVFSDIEPLEVFRLEGVDKAGNRILRIVGKHFPAKVISGERLKNYIFRKVLSELQEGPFCVVYMHSTVQKEDNSPGLQALRWIYEELPSEFKERLRVVYFLHPGLRSRVALATLGRFFLSGGLYWKIKYVSRLQYLWEDIRKGQVEIPEFVKNHDDVLEHRPLTDYGIEPDPFHLTNPHHLAEPPSVHYSFGRPGDRLGFRASEYE